jgi:hypothetical protein
MRKPMLILAAAVAVVAAIVAFVAWPVPQTGR